MYPVRSISSKKGAFHLSRPASIYRLLPHWHCSSPERPQGSPPTLPDPFWSWLTRYRRGQNPAQAIPQGDRKGPHPAPHRPRPYNDTSLCDTPLVVIVRAGAVWSGVGTLAVGLLVGLLSPLSLPFACH